MSNFYCMSVTPISCRFNGTGDFAFLRQLRALFSKAGVGRVKTLTREGARRRDGALGGDARKVVSTGTAQLSDGQRDELTLDEVERIVI